MTDILLCLSCLAKGLLQSHVSTLRDRVRQLAKNGRDLSCWPFFLFFTFATNEDGARFFLHTTRILSDSL